MAPGADGQIWPRAGGPYIGHQRAKPDLFIAVVRHRPDDARMGVERIEVRRFAHAELETRVIHGAVDGRPALRPIALDHDRPIAAVDRVSAEIDVVFDGDEQRQQVRPSPALIPPRGPAIEIEWRAARRDRCVHHRRAADQTPARHAQASAPQRAGAVGVDEVPVELRYPARAAPMVFAAEGEQRRDRFLLREIRAGLEQQNLPRGVLRQTRRDHAAARTRAHNNDVVMVHRSSPKSASRRGSAGAYAGIRRRQVINDGLTHIFCPARLRRTTSPPLRHCPCCRP